MDGIQVENRLHHLVNGYIKQKFDAYKTYDHFEASLINIMVIFLGNILIVFDIYPSKCKSMFSGHGTKFKREKSDHVHGSFTFGCSNGWNKGVHKVSIQTKDTTYYDDAFGITSNIDHFKRNTYWYGSSGCDKGFFYTLNGDTLVTMNEKEFGNKTQTRVFNKIKRKPNDKISICLDANEWTVKWLFNDQQLGKPFNVVANETYHLFISSGAHSKTVKYHLIVDY